MHKLSLKTVLSIATCLAAPLTTQASLQGLSGGSLQVTYSEKVANWMINSTAYNPPYDNISFFDASYNTVQQNAYGGGFAMTANPFLQGSEGWDQTFNFSFNLSQTPNPAWRSTVQQINTLLVDYNNGDFTSTGELGLSGVLRVDNGATYACYGDFLLSQTSAGVLSLDNFQGFTVPDAFQLVIDETKTTYSGNTITLFGDFAYGNPAVAYFFQGYEGPNLGTFQLTFQTVPEPSVAMLLLGAIAVIYLSRRKRASTAYSHAA